MKFIIKTLMTCLLAIIIAAGSFAGVSTEAHAATPIRFTINMAAKKKMTVVKRNRYKMKAVISGKTITVQGKWTSSNKKVATVTAKGVVKAGRTGSATIKVTYKGKSLRTIIKVKAKCTKHTWKVTKKATCKVKGKQTCSVCGVTEAIAKKAHTWQTDTWESVEGRGTPFTVDTVECNGCNVDMTFWTQEERNAHRFDWNNLECFGAGIHGVSGKTVYLQYMKVKKTEITCKTCGAWKDKYQEDLYECDNKGNRLTSSSVISTADKTATMNAVAAPQEVIETPTPEAPVIDSGAVSTNIVSDNETILANTVVTDQIASE